MKKKVYFNHDGAIDDLVSLFLLLQMEEIELTGVSIIDADCYIEPATSATLKIMHRFGEDKSLSVSKSNSRGKNPFPKEWRLDAFYVNALPILNETASDMTLSTLPAHTHLLETLRKTDGKTTLLFTGPLTDLARALHQDAKIEEKIEKLYWMGGTLLNKGNVEECGHDGSAEWNAFWDPDAVRDVFSSHIDIDMVALESTNKIPLTKDLQQSWARERNYVGLDFIGQCYALRSPLYEIETHSTYYLWDVLATLSLDNPSLVTKRIQNINVYTEGTNQGKMEEFDAGRPVNVVYDVDKDAFYATFQRLAKKASSSIVI